MRPSLVLCIVLALLSWGCDEKSSSTDPDIALTDTSGEDTRIPPGDTNEADTNAADTAAGDTGSAGDTTQADTQPPPGDTAQADTPQADTVTPPPAGCDEPTVIGPTLYVATDGSDDSGDGSEGAPWATITHALDNASDGDTILVQPGTYEGRIRMRGSFGQGVTVRSAVPYQARLRHTEAVMTFYTHSSGCEGITVEGFDIAHSGPGASPLVVHIDGGGDGSVSRITLRNNVLHDSYNNDILKINNATTQIVVERNLFYNQTGSDEHIDFNSVEDVIVQDNIFMSDFEGSGRTNTADTSSYIVIKDSNGNTDAYTGSANLTLRRNVFLHWQGDSGTGFLLIGEDGQPFFEGRDITVENNLFLGDSDQDMRAPFGVKGGQNIVFRSNTVVGDLPSRAFAMRLNVEGSNPANENIQFYNNIWSDPTGSMGQLADGSGALDFSDTPPADITSFTLANNLYFNGSSTLPDTSDDAINPSDDGSSVTADPQLPSLSGLVLPRWDPSSGFADGSTSICAAHRTLVESYGTPAAGSAALDAADASQLPDDDILGNPRGSTADLGAVEVP